MCKKRFIFLNIVILILFTGYSVAREIKEVNFTGKVTDTKGNPIAGAKVTVYEMHSDGVAGNILLQQVGEATTTENGRFLIVIPLPIKNTLMDGYIVAQKDGLSLGWTTLNMREDTDIDIKLGEPQQLQGVVVNLEGNPVAGAQVGVNLYQIETNSEGEAKKQWLPGIAPLQELTAETDSKGEFAFDSLPAETRVDLLVRADDMATIYTYSIQSTGPRFRTGQTNIKISTPSEGRIAGQMIDTDTNQPIARRKFAVIPMDSKVFFYRSVCATDENGTFSIGRLRAGKYLIKGDGFEDIEIEVSSGKTSELIIRTPKLLYGRILRHDDQVPFCDTEPWPGAKVHVRYDSSKYGLLRSCIDRDGYFALPISEEEFHKLERGELEISIYYPSDTEEYFYGIVGKFPAKKLSIEKEKAGVAKPFDIAARILVSQMSLEPPFIKGKPLPELKEFGSELSAIDNNDKSILVCFFDMEQRPSRNFMTQFRKKAEDLKAKDITVVAVQAAKVEQEKLEEWITQNNISFPIGMIQIDSSTEFVKVEETLHLTWGAQSLPWLILTNKEHVVIAEGFAVNELDEKITSLKEK
jgi:hypothetical protein